MHEDGWESQESSLGLFIEWLPGVDACFGNIMDMLASRWEQVSPYNTDHWRHTDRSGSDLDICPLAQAWIELFQTGGQIREGNYKQLSSNPLALEFKKGWNIYAWMKRNQSSAAERLRWWTNLGFNTTTEWLGGCGLESHSRHEQDRVFYPGKEFQWFSLTENVSYSPPNKINSWPICSRVLSV